MLVISSREFRDNQKKYMDLVDKNEQVIIQRGKEKSYVLTPVGVKDKYFMDPDTIADIQEGISQYRKGVTTKVDKADDIPCHPLINEDCLLHHRVLGQKVRPVQLEGLVVSGEVSRHLNGIRIYLVLVEDGQILFDHLPQQDFVRHLVASIICGARCSA